MRNIRNFTLIELLVVIAIIGILASLLFPGLVKARDKSIAAVCMSNLKNQGVGAHVSESSQNELPRGGWGPIRWFHDIALYTQGYTNIFKCPSPEASGILNTGWPQISDYGYNAHANSNKFAGFKRSGEVVDASETPLIHELVYQNNFPFWVYNMTLANKDHNSAFAIRHVERGNVLWIDNHVSQKAFMSYINQAQQKGAWDFITGQ